MKSEKYCPKCDTTKPAEEFYKIRGKYLSALCKPCDIAKAAEYGKNNPERRKKYRETYRAKNSGTVAYRVRQIHEGMVERSRKRGWPYPEFSKEEITEIVTNGVCERTGVPFQFDIITGTRNPWTPVPDRVDSNLPYTKENVQWVCNIYNAAKQAWTDDEVALMARALVDKEEN